MGRESKVKGPRRERRPSWLPRMRLIAVAVSGSIGGAGYAGGSETRPYWRIGVEEVAKCNSMDEPATNLRQRTR